MRVLVIAQLFPPDMGGGGTRAYNVVKGLISLGHVVTVVTAFPHYPTGEIPREYRRRLLAVKSDGKLRILRTWVPPIASSGSMRRLVLFASFCASSLLALPLVGRINVVWAANPNIFAIFPALVYRALKRCPIVQNVDDIWPEEVYELDMMRSSLIRRLGEFVARLTYRTSSALTPISPAYVNVIVNKYKASVNKVHVVPAGVDLKGFATDKGYSRNRRDRREFRVLYLGALSPTYNFDQVLEAASLISSKKGIKFIIQGAGELGSEIEAKVNKMRLRNVEVKLKIVKRDKVPKILSDADVLLLPLSGLGSIEMGISSKLYEYQAAGRPIICCSRGQPGRYVSKTGSGMVVKPGDSKGIVKDILYLYNNRKIAKSLGEAGKRYVEDRLSCEKIASKMESIFNSVSIRK